MCGGDAFDSGDVVGVEMFLFVVHVVDLVVVDLLLLRHLNISYNYTNIQINCKRAIDRWGGECREDLIDCMALGSS